MIAVDTNILVYAHRQESPHYQPAARRVRELAEGRARWAIPWPCIHEFISVVTRPRLYDPPTGLAHAIDQVNIWFELPELELLGEFGDHWTWFAALALAARSASFRVYDARIAAICLANGVRELWSADRDFGRFPDLRVVNPLIG